MALTEIINDQMKAAMKSGDKQRLETIRSIRALILEFEKSGAARAMTEEDEQKILLFAAKRRKDSVEQYRAAKRDDLADKEAAELLIIQEFLPKQMTEEEVEIIVKGIIEQMGAKTPQEVGKVVGASMKELRGKTDGNVVQAVVKRLLGA